MKIMTEKDRIYFLNKGEALAIKSRLKTVIAAYIGDGMVCVRGPKGIKAVPLEKYNKKKFIITRANGEPFKFLEFY